MSHTRNRYSEKDESIKTVKDLLEKRIMRIVLPIIFKIPFVVFCCICYYVWKSDSAFYTIMWGLAFLPLLMITLGLAIMPYKGGEEEIEAGCNTGNTCNRCGKCIDVWYDDHGTKHRLHKTKGYKGDTTFWTREQKPVVGW